MVQSRYSSFRAAALCVTLAAGIFFSGDAQARGPHRVFRHAHRELVKRHSATRGNENAFACAVHTAYGEANKKSQVEQAVVINGLIESAHQHGRSVCAEAHARYAPVNRSTPGIVAAAINVFSQGATMVPPRFRHATEFRAPTYHKLHEKGLRYLGQVSRGGNVFYTWANYAPARAFGNAPHVWQYNMR